MERRSSLFDNSKISKKNSNKDISLMIYCCLGKLLLLWKIVSQLLNSSKLDKSLVHTES